MRPYCGIVVLLSFNFEPLLVTHYVRLAHALWVCFLKLYFCWSLWGVRYEFSGSLSFYTGIDDFVWDLWVGALMMRRWFLLRSFNPDGLILNSQWSLDIFSQYLPLAVPCSLVHLLYLLMPNAVGSASAQPTDLEGEEIKSELSFLVVPMCCRAAAGTCVQSYWEVGSLDGWTERRSLEQLSRYLSSV